MRLARTFTGDQRGVTAVLFGVCLPLLLLVAGACIDYAGWTRQASRLQSATDAAALAAAQELTVSSGAPERIRSVARSVVASQLAGEAYEVRAEVLGESRVRVVLEQARRSAFVGRLVDAGPLSTDATATVSGRRRLCVLALDPGAAETLHLKSNSALSARDCDVFSNARSAKGIDTDSGITVAANLTCSAGGIHGQGQVRGRKQTDCPALPDPLAGRPAPPVASACGWTNRRVEVENTPGSRLRLEPGVYCGGLFIGANSFVEFSPGVYVMKDGPLVIDSNADARGRHVGFYFTGQDATFHFTSNARVDLDAPRDGPMAGILMFEERGAQPHREYRITSNYATNMTGTIYLPRGRFVVDAANDVAQHSAFTVIIARRVLLTASPKLVLNTSYHATDVPVPEGVVSGGAVRLTD